MTIRNNLKSLAKRVIKLLPIAFTKNQQYDRQTRVIIKKVCNITSNCVDVGTHKGEILDIFLKTSPRGFHYGFEPIPVMFESLKQKYFNKKNIFLFDYALSNDEGTTEFNYVTSNPAYSGLIKRKYDRPNETDTKITVKTNRLDNVIIPQLKKIDLIKIDVEGAEMKVLEGAVETIEKYSPVIIFEFGIGGSDIYGTTPEKLFAFFNQFNYHISLMKDYLYREPPLSMEDFKKQFYGKLNYYFVAYKANG
jgi:FkbM family methyltransferase